MNSNLQAQLDKAMHELTAQQQRIQDLEEQLRSKTVTVRSKDRMVSVTVDSSGGMSKLEFHDERYRSMARAELADAIVRVFSEARNAMNTQVNELVEPSVGEMDSLRESLHDSSSWGEFLAPLLKMQKETASRMNGVRRDG